MTNYIFFDMDGTLWDHRERIPQSAVCAIDRLRENGNRVFINTGRSRANLNNPILGQLDMDGIVAACGTHIEMDGSILYERLLSPDLLQRTVAAARYWQLPLIVEGPEFDWFNPEEFGDDHYARRMWISMGSHVRRLDTLQWSTDRVNKAMLLIGGAGDRYAAFEKELAEDFTFINHRGQVAEIVAKGYSKATGIEWLCRHFDIDRQALYAFGDGVNDLDMLTYVPHSIAMGNGRDLVKDVCEYVTAPIDRDGIWQAMTHYGLI